MSELLDPATRIRDAEMIVVGRIIRSRRDAAKASRLLAPDHFSADDHRALFIAGSDPTVQEVQGSNARTSRIAHAAGLPFNTVNLIAGAYPTGTRVDPAIRTLLEADERRRLLNLGSALVHGLLNGATLRDVAPLVAELKR